MFNSAIVMDLKTGESWVETYMSIEHKEAVNVQCQDDLWFDYIDSKTAPIQLYEIRASTKSGELYSVEVLACNIFHAEKRFIMIHPNDQSIFIKRKYQGD